MKKLLIMLTIILLTGCATQTFHVQSGKSYATKDDMQIFFLEGIGQSKDIDAAAVCGGAEKVAKIEVEQNFVDSAFALFTYHIFTPRNAKVYCTR